MGRIAQALVRQRYLFAILFILQSSSCQYPGTCAPPISNYKWVSEFGPMRMEWVENGGYCGASAIQMAALSFGIWISQDQVRQHTPPPPIAFTRQWDTAIPLYGNEILHSNIGGALNNLKLQVKTWDWRSTNDTEPYLRFLFHTLKHKIPVVWFVMCAGDPHSAGEDGSCDGGGQYDHAEPVFGLYSNSTEYNKEAVVVFAAEQDEFPYFRTIRSLPDTREMNGNCKNAVPGVGTNEMYPCVQIDGPNYGWGIMGIKDPEKRSKRVWLDVGSPTEPSFRFGAEVTHFKGRVHFVDPLTHGERYTLFRFDSSEKVPTDSDFENGEHTFAHSFIADSKVVSYADPMPIVSSSVVYYVLVESPFNGALGELEETFAHWPTEWFSWILIILAFMNLCMMGWISHLRMNVLSLMNNERTPLLRKTI